MGQASDKKSKVTKIGQTSSAVDLGSLVLAIRPPMDSFFINSPSKALNFSGGLYVYICLLNSMLVSSMCHGYLSRLNHLISMFSWRQQVNMNSSMHFDAGFCA